MNGPKLMVVVELRRTRFIFDNTADRDLYIHDNFPMRKCTDVPGMYQLPDGRSLEVFCEEVTLEEVLNSKG